MSTVLDVISDAVAAHGLVVGKAIPRSPDHLILELRRSDGPTVAGQWFAHEDRARTVFEQTRRATPGHGVHLLDGSRVLLQPGGADRRLPSLRDLASEPGATLVAHRPEHRGVVRRAADSRATTYTKVVRAKRFVRVLRGARLTVPGVAVPRVLAANEDAATITLAELPGCTLFELLGDSQASDAQVVTAGRAVGRALAKLHEVVPPPDVPSHDADAELGVTGRWVELATGHDLLKHLPVPADRLLASLREQLGGRACRATLLHRDLHDKQLLLGDDQVGLLDFDLAAVGEPGVDLANLLVHLRLRALQGRCSVDRAGTCAAAVLDGYSPDTALRHRLDAYRVVTAVRLACVYAFRPAHAHVGAALLEELMS